MNLDFFNKQYKEKGIKYSVSYLIKDKNTNAGPWVMPALSCGHIITSDHGIYNFWSFGKNWTIKNGLHIPQWSELFSLSADSIDEHIKELASFMNYYENNTRTV